MKKITLALLLLSSFTILLAQAPQKMSYQSVIRNTDGKLVSGTLVNIKTSILSGSASGIATYVETQTTTTNNNGLATIEIGGGTPVIGTFSGVNWGAESHFVKTEIDPTGGSNYTISGTSQLLSVPYALYAGSSQNKGKTSVVLTGDITDAQAAAQIAAELGSQTENVYVLNTTNLINLDLSAVKNLVNLNINGNLNLVTVNLSNLNEVYNQLNIEENEKLSSASFPVLKVMYGARTAISRNPSLTSISFPLLTKCKNFYLSNNAVLTSIDLPVLSSTYDYMATLAFTKNALPSSQINLLLSTIVKISPAGGKYIGLMDQNPPAPPTGQGVIDKSILIDRGNNVVTD
jgi:hypothetical protein